MQVKLFSLVIMSLATQKNELRNKARAQRQKIMASQWQVINHNLCRYLSRLLKTQCPNRVFSYVATNEELDPTEALSEFMPVGLPCVLGVRQMEFYPWTTGQKLVKNRFGILEPTISNASAWSPKKGDIMIVPCVSLDSRGTRLGYGGGFYDSYLSQHCEPIIKVGVCLKRSIVSELPREAHDVFLDWGVSEAGILEFKKRGT